MKLAVFLALFLLSVGAYAACDVNKYWQIVKSSDFEQNYNQYKSECPNFDWTTDGCSVPAEVQDLIPLSHTYCGIFYWPCRQHDFGYRNADTEHVLNEDARKQVDDQLLASMKKTCSNFSCKAVAESFYSAVRLFGGRVFGR